jgi:hypothetical protein
LLSSVAAEDAALLPQRQAHGQDRMDQAEQESGQFIDVKMGKNKFKCVRRER